MRIFSDELHNLTGEFDEMKRVLRGTRFELQKKVKELAVANERLKKSEQELKIKFDDLSQNESAMLNIIEDARGVEKKLKKERDLTSAVISSMVEGLLVVDSKKKIILMNQAASILLRVAPSEAVDKDVEQIFSLFKKTESVYKDHRLPITDLTTEANMVNMELEDDFYCKNSDGKYFPVAATLASLLQTSYLEGVISGVVIIFRDISKEKSLDEAKSGFISIASHQLRTPLTSIRWFSEMMLDGDAGKLGKDQRHFIERIYQGAERMINLVNLLLQIARVEAGRVKIEPVPTDFKILTEEVILTLQSQLNEKKQKIKIVTEPNDIPKIPMDNEVAWQIIQNLLTNAIRYSQMEGIITITISLNEKKKEVLYAVKDEGLGIPKDDQERVFEKFFRAANAVKYVPEGSGLGLNLVKKLVEDWGGKIWFETKEGKGSTFFFTIPLKGVEPKKGEVKLKV